MSALQIDGVGPVLHINYDFILSLIRLLLRDFRLVPAQIRVNQLINANMISFGLFLATQTSLLLLRCFVFADRKLARKNRAELKANFGRILIHYMRNRSQTACAIFSHLQLDACRPIRERYKNHAPEEKGKFGGEFVPCSDHWIWRGQWTGTQSYKNRIFNLFGKNAVGLEQLKEGKLLSWSIAVFGEDWRGKFASSKPSACFTCVLREWIRGHGCVSHISMNGQEFRIDMIRIMKFL